MEEKLLDFDRDIKKIAEKIDWLDTYEEKFNYIINFCINKAKN